MDLKLAEERINKGECPICGKNEDYTKLTLVRDARLGEILICTEHLGKRKLSGENQC